MAARMETRKDYIMLTQLEARIYLAEQLPERILVSAKTSYHREGIFWIGKYDENNLYRYVRETEWQQIALWVEEKMTDEQFINYRNQLIMMIPESNAETEQGRFVLSANYTTRATAMKESGL